MTIRGRRDRGPTMLVALLFIGIVQGQMLTYNSSTKQIHFRCPRDPDMDGEIMFIQLAKLSSPAQALANWTLEHGPAGEETKLEVSEAKAPYKLEAIMKHVSCKDSGNYRCYVQRDSAARGTYEIKEDEAFTYEGEVTVPVTSRNPLKSRYKIKDTVTFTCKALIGTENNTFIWETKLPSEETFTEVKEEGDPCTKIKQKTEQKPTCDWEAETSLQLELSAADDGREWRCRLQQTNHAARITVAVECEDEDGCRYDCNSRDSKNKTTTKSQTADSAGNEKFGQVAASRNGEEEPGRVGASRGKGGDGENGLSASTTVLVLIIVLPVCATVAFIAAVIACRHRRDKQVPPLVVMESPAPTEYGGSLIESKYTLSPPPSRCSRRLPDPPTHSPLSSRDSHTTTDTADTTYTTANDYTDDEDTSRKLLVPYNLGDNSRPTSSVYVRMSAVNLATESADQGGDGRGGAGVHGTTVEGEWGGGGRMLLQRADSVYSNGAVVQAERERANSADGGDARAHATFRKELM